MARMISATITLKEKKHPIFGCFFFFSLDLEGKMLYNAHKAYDDLLRYFPKERKQDMKTLYLIAAQRLGRIAPEIYGHFSEHIGGVIYDGLWVGKSSAIPNIRGFRRDLIEKLRAIKPAVLRWPGGCFAEVYDWRDGIGADRPVRRNWWQYKDGRRECNEVGTHEFIDLCELIGAKPYFAANLTSLSPMHVRNWMDYCLSPRGSTTLALEREKNGRAEPFDIPFWGVGNENWCGGGNMRPEYYADECRKYAEVMHNVSRSAELYACGTDAFDYTWAQGVIPVLASARLNHLNGFSMHYYCGSAGDPLHFTEEEWDELIGNACRMEEIILRNWSILCAYGMEGSIKLIVDEWGCWHPDGSGPSKGANLFEQQSTMRDAVVAALTLNIFNRHCDKVRMANVAQLVNNLHALFLAAGEHCIVTPTYHVFDMYKEHQGATAIQAFVTDDGEREPSLSVSASLKNGKLLVTLANLSCRTDAEVSLACVGASVKERATMRVLACNDMHAHNTFEDPEAVQPTQIEISTKRPVTVPRAGVVALELELL